MSGRDFWRVGSFFKATSEIERTLVIDVKMFILLKHLDPEGTKFGVKLDQIKVYLPRKGWGVYEGGDYPQSKAIKQLFRLSDDDWKEKIHELIRLWSEAILQDGDALGIIHERLLELVEPPLFRAALEKHRQCAAAARDLGMHRTTLKKKMDHYGIEDNE